VVGKPDERLGEEVVAFLVAQPGATIDTGEVGAWAKERLAAYKYPRDIRVVEALPKGPTGKILKKDLEV
jgi:long-chain acyl-CoA synthetase